MKIAVQIRSASPFSQSLIYLYQMNLSEITDLIRQYIKESIIVETVDVFIPTAKEDYSRLDSLHHLCYYLLDKVFKPVTDKMPTDQINYFHKNGIGYYETLVPDGTFYSDPQHGGHGNTGVINFYTSGFTSQTLVQILKNLFSEFRKLGIKWGKIKQDKSKMYKDQNVIRIPIIQWKTKQYQGPPELNMSNRNAHHIFKEVLQYEKYDNGISLDASELKKRILTLEHDLGWIKGHEIPNSITKTEPSEPGEEWKNDEESDDENPHDKIVNQIGSQMGGAIMYNMGLSEENIKERLDAILNICDWAIKNGHKHISVG